MKRWNLFIDDERVMSDIKWAPLIIQEKYRNEDFVVCRSKLEVIMAIFDHEKTLPSFISFDHDLGEGEPSGHEIAKWIVESDLSGLMSMPEDFDFCVHSKNPVGKVNIEEYLRGYLRHKDYEKVQGRRDNMSAVAEKDYEV